MLSVTAWVNASQSTIVSERSEQSQVLYVIPVSSILGRLPHVPIGETGTIPFEMRKESADFLGAARPAISPITAAMGVGGGTSTAGPSNGEQSSTNNSGNKLGDTTSQGHFP